MNEAWRNHRFEDLYKYYHDDVVMLPPGGSEPIAGVEAMVESYRQFGKIGTIYQFEITELTVFTFDTIAICHMRFTVDYKTNSNRFNEEGLEIYTVAISGAVPKIVWRTQVTLKTDE